MAPPRRSSDPFYDLLKAQRRRYDPAAIGRMFGDVSERRVRALAANLAVYIGTNLSSAVEKRNGLADYRTNPYVLLTCASVMNLDDPATFGTFLFNSKLYMGLETSFGKSVESTLVGAYPIRSERKWQDAPEKIAESAALKGLSREERARRRVQSVWREIDKSCVIGSRRFLTSIKSGPNTINDTQVQGMTDAITTNYLDWLAQTRRTYPGVDSLDVVLGLTYGTDKTTNNKENQILAKLTGEGFVEEDRSRYPGVLVDEKTGAVRVYRRIGSDFWAFIGQPDRPATAKFVFLEILLSLAMALRNGVEKFGLEDRINLKIQHLAQALAQLQFPRRSLPSWVGGDFTDDQLFWFATAMSAFFDEGI